MEEYKYPETNEEDAYMPLKHDLELFKNLIDLEYKRRFTVDSGHTIWTKMGIITGLGKKSVIASLIKEDTIGEEQTTLDTTENVVNDYVEEIREVMWNTLPSTLLVTNYCESWSQIFLTELEIDYKILNRDNLQKVQELAQTKDVIMVTPKMYIMLCQHTAKFAWKRVIFDHPEEYPGNILRRILSCFVWIYTDNLIDLIEKVQEKANGKNNFIWELLMNGNIINEKYSSMIFE